MDTPTHTYPIRHGTYFLLQADNDGLPKPLMHPDHECAKRMTFVVFNRSEPAIQGLFRKKSEVIENTQFFSIFSECPNMWYPTPCEYSRYCVGVCKEETFINRYFFTCSQKVYDRCFLAKKSSIRGPY